MIVSREKILEFLCEAELIDLKHLWFGEHHPFPDRKTVIHGMPRIILPLSGKKHILFAGSGRRYDTIFTPGDAIVTHPGGWTCEIWDMPHRMISIVFREDCVRVLYIAHNGCPPDQNGPDVFFHTRHPLSAEGDLTLRALLTANRDHPAVRFNFHALLEIVRESLEEPSANLSVEEQEWARVEEALLSNFRGDVVREDIAEIAKLHPAKLSRLMRERKSCSVREYLTELRMKHALELLKRKDLSIGEIAVDCGYNYVNYFIRIFRRHFGITPGEYRNRQ